MPLTQPLVKLDALAQSAKISNHSSRAEQNRTLYADLESILAYRQWINFQTHQHFDQSRILAVLAAGRGAENYLSHTIPKIIDQISEIGIGADLLLGLNHGFECPEIIDQLNLIPNLEIIHLYTEEKLSNQIPAEIFDHFYCKGKPYCISSDRLQSSKHRIFIIHQRMGPYSAGKIRILGDIYGSLLINSIAQGWIPPALLITIDAESQFLVDRRGSFPNLDSNGLIPIIEQLKNNPDTDILGATPRHVVYRQSVQNRTKIFLPDFSQEVPPIPWFLNIVHGYYPGYQLKPGGGTVGKTDIMISLLTMIAERYPGTRLEDIQLTILAEHAGFKHELCMDVIQTNRVPSMTDMTPGDASKLAWVEQMYRWMSGIEALKLNYGRHNIESIVSDTFPWSIVINPRFFLRSLSQKQKLNIMTVFKLLKTLFASSFNLFLLKRRALNNADVLQGSEAKAAWQSASSPD
jgi:hypothetical protein